MNNNNNNNNYYYYYYYIIKLCINFHPRIKITTYKNIQEKVFFRYISRWHPLKSDISICYFLFHLHNQNTKKEKKNSPLHLFDLYRISRHFHDKGIIWLSIFWFSNDSRAKLPPPTPLSPLPLFHRSPRVFEAGGEGGWLAVEPQESRSINNRDPAKGCGPSSQSSSICRPSR